MTRAMQLSNPNAPSPGRVPRVLVVGAAHEPEFRDAVRLLGESASVAMAADAELAVLNCDSPSQCPDLIVVVQSRPGVISHRDFIELVRRAPLAGVVAVVGSWCEGELRTGRPWSGGRRMYWHEFPGWWRRQQRLLDTGRCPDWALPAAAHEVKQLASIDPSARSERGLVMLHTSCWETADALGDVLRDAGYAASWQSGGQTNSPIWGPTAGIWEGRQLDDAEADSLAAFCQKIGPRAPVVALLDFPRSDLVDRSLAVGAAAVLGKPCLNEDLLSTLDEVLTSSKTDDQHPIVARAA